MISRAVIIGAGPAGLTAAHEFSLSGVDSVILEADPLHVGGISRTVEYKGFRFDIGGHRFFSKNQKVEDLWTQWLGADLLQVPRLSRIFYRGKFYDYPLKIVNACSNLGLGETVRCLASWVRAHFRPRKPEQSFEDWVVNRFGFRLYSIFFRAYTEKVWGMPCGEISADWASQRIKDLNLFKAGLNAIGWKSPSKQITTLIDSFRYPILGPGMMWDEVARLIQESGCTLCKGEKVHTISWGAAGIEEVVTSKGSYKGDAFLSTMPVRSLVRALSPPAPEAVQRAARQLKYRDYLTVVLIIEQESVFADNWIYIHDPAVSVGRIQNYKNWSSQMVPDRSVTSLGLEYFCDVGDEIWQKTDGQLVELGMRELSHLGLVDASKFRDGTVVRMPKAYPVYDHDYRAHLETIERFVVDELPNLQMLGRNGMHRYNNQDHAMWTGILAARNALGVGKYDLKMVNENAEYLEEVNPSRGRLVPEGRQRV